MLRSVLQLLLCLCLLVELTAGAGSAMAGPTGSAGGHPARTAAAMPGCDMHAHATAGSPADHADPHAHDRGAHKHSGDCCSQGGCDCMQHCGSTLGLAVAIVVGHARAAAPAWALRPLRAIPGHEQPVRPPIFA